MTFILNKLHKWMACVLCGIYVYGACSERKPET